MVGSEKVIRASPSFIHLSFSLSPLRFMYIARPIGFSSPLRWWNHVCSTLFSFVSHKNMPASIGEEQFCNGWWCGCYQRRVPYVSGIKWHASRFDYVLLLPSRLRRSEQACDIHSSKTKTRRRRRRRRRRTRLLYSMCMVRRREQPLVPFSRPHQRRDVCNDAEGYGHALSSSWQWEKLNRTNERTNERANEMEDDIWTPVFIQDDKAIGDGLHCRARRFPCMLPTFSPSLAHWLTHSVHSMLELLYSLLVYSWSYSYTHLLAIFHIRLSMSPSVPPSLSLSPSFFLSLFLIDTKRQAVCAYIHVALSRFVCSVLDGSVSLCALLIFLPPYRIRLCVCARARVCVRSLRSTRFVYVSYWFSTNTRARSRLRTHSHLQTMMGREAHRGGGWKMKERERETKRRSLRACARSLA